MPDIKNQFTGGKMNKDLDERLVPKGEYRDAMNIQVSTSEGSDVGTVQNILGNKLVDALSYLSANSTCVGAVADEKDDALYWFVTNVPSWYVPIASVIDPTFHSGSFQGVQQSYKDMILQLKNGFIIPVFVAMRQDVAYSIYQVGTNISWDSTAGTITLPSSLSVTDLEVGMVLYGDSDTQQQSYTGMSVGSINVGTNTITINGDITWLDSVVSQQDQIGTKLFFSLLTDSEQATILGFKTDNMITGINIIDDMLFWTDGYSEPKKINITRSIAGTSVDGLQHTSLINTAASLTGKIREEHITVIRKTPKGALQLELSDGRDPLLSYTGKTQVAIDQTPPITSIITSSNLSALYDFSTLSIGDIISFTVDANIDSSGNMDFQWDAGGFLLLKEFNSDGSYPASPLANWTIRGLITNWPNNNFNSNSGTVKVEIEVVGLNGTPSDPPSGQNDPLFYVVDYEDTDPVIFEDKLPRFSYRYEYQDGEYSTFAPWSEVAFIPKPFNYDPKRGWNTGMLNNLKSIKAKGFIPGTWNNLAEHDVVKVDILYKEDISPNIYLVETISPLDVSPSWQNDEYEIKSETIKNVISSNQLLRSWDNVPKKALAQDISGNRIVYANYEQGYDLGLGYKPDFKNSLVAWGSPQSGVPKKSIKSLRDYKLGVVFTDRYGRETPVLINESGGFKVQKMNSINANRLKVGLKGDPPVDMAWYRFYIKETSTEYYNLAMDRWYKAEDGNIWLAFPSSDRNKMDLDTFLYFKRGAKNDDGVLENSTKYKVLAIENEAPEFIKTRKVRIGTVGHYAGSTQLFGDSTDGLLDAPMVSGISFAMNFSAGFGGTSLSRMEDIKEDIYVQFVSSGDSSEQYKISEITSDRDETSVALSNEPENYYVTLTTNLKDNINFIYDNSNAPSKIKDDVKVVFTKAIVENKPQFDGRFFAKIENDGKIKTQITDDSLGVNYIEKAFKTVYLLEHDNTLKAVSAAAVSTPDGNYIDHDYSGEVSDTTYSGYNNFNGSNWNHLAARESYFQDADDLTTDFTDGISAGRLVSRFNRIDNDASKGVWFIDRSTKKYSIPTSGSDDDTLMWPDNNNMNHVSPQCNLVGSAAFGGCGSSIWNVNDKIGSGVVSNSGSSSISLGFGGIQHISGWSGYYSSGGGSKYFDNPKDNYFGIGTTNSNWDDSITTEFVASLGAGFSFKWREDPTETVYKVEGQTTYSRDLRFARHDDGFTNHTTDLIGAISSYTKTWDITVTPPMVGWNPAAPTGTVSGQGEMLNGLILGDGVFYVFVTSVDALVNATEIVLGLADDISAIKPGMSVGIHANIPNLSKVIAVDYAQKKVTIDLGVITGTISSGTSLSFGYTIRVVEAHIYGGNSTTDPRDNYIVVDNIETECSNGNSLKPTYNLHKGMILDSYNLDTLPCSSVACEPISRIIIESIEPHVNGYKIKLAGYNAPMNYYQSSGTIADDFVLDERLLFKQVSMNGASNFTEFNTNTSQVNTPVANGNAVGMIGAVGYDMVMVEPVDEYGDGGNLPPNPFVWETEPKENTDLDIYHEISENNPITLNNETINTAIPIGSTIKCPGGEGGVWDNVTVVNNNFGIGNEIEISEYIWIGPAGYIFSGYTYPLEVGSILRITKPNGVQFSVEVSEIIESPVLNTISNRFKLTPSLYNSNYFLGWHNCYSFGNGVESNRIKDTFNSPFISNGVKVSTTLDQEYKKEHRKYGLIYSGLYNSTSGVNNLNQFIAAEKITKDINPIYGSIQKIYAGWGQGGDLVALCEDRVLKILANKDALFNADGNSNVTSTNSVLGQAIPYSGEYGISKNPESFASEAYRIYFTDKVRGTVMRLSMDGLTPISNHGMKDWFKDNLKLNNTILGSYDDKKDEYNVTLQQTDDASRNNNPVTVSFKEDVKGWVSFKSFTSENAISCANEYYTFKNANIWKHHDESVPRNTFHNEGQSNSTLNVILNDLPGSVKSFNTINYEGSQSRVVPNLQDNQYYNLALKPGWYVDSIFTNKESGSLEEFIEKEGKWFNYIKGKEIQHSGSNIIVNPDGSSSFDQASFAIQGLGILGGDATGGLVYGCTDPVAFNYNPSATTDDGSCEPVSYGCLEATADNTCNNNCNTEDGSCIWSGCCCIGQFFPNGCTNTDLFTEANAYDAIWNTQYGVINCDYSCIAVTSGCTDATAFNYDSSANVDDGSCIAVHEGCMEPTANENYDSLANTEDGTCIWRGCTDSTTPANNYLWEGSTVNSLATSQGWNTATLVAGGNATGYFPVSSVHGMLDTNSTICTYDEGCTDAFADNASPGATVDDGSCEYCGEWADGELYGTVQGYSTGNNSYGVTITNETYQGYNDGTIEISIPSGTFPADFASIFLYGDYNGPASNSSGPYYPINTGVTTAVYTGVPPGDYYFYATQGSAAMVGDQATPCFFNSYASGMGVYQMTVTPGPNPNGCTDSTACNYNAIAIVDDGSCVYAGCGDPQATNFGNVGYQEGCGCTAADASCCTYTPQPIQGCTDPTACNYDITATSNDGSCNYTSCAGCLDDRQNNAQTGIAASNYDSTKTIHDQSQCTYNYNMSTDLSGPLAGNDFIGNSSTSPNWTDELVGSGASGATKVSAVFDVSNAPPIRFPGYNAGGVYSPTQTSIRETQFSWNMPGYTSDWSSGVAGDITTYYGFSANSVNSPIIEWSYSNDNGATWLDGPANYVYGNEVRLVKFYIETSVDESSGLLDWGTYPYGYNGKIYQNAKFGFTDVFLNSIPYALTDDVSSGFSNGHKIEESESVTIITGCTQAGYCNTSGTYGFTSNANWPTNVSDNPCGGTPGCNLPAACNYNPNADCNDNSCSTPIVMHFYTGNSTCQSPSSPPCENCYSTSNCAGNYNSCHGTLYNSQTACQIANMSGCTTSTACNYDDCAVVDDGSCIVPINDYYENYNIGNAGCTACNLGSTCGTLPQCAATGNVSLGGYTWSEAACNLATGSN